MVGVSDRVRSLKMDPKHRSVRCEFESNESAEYIAGLIKNSDFLKRQQENLGALMIVSIDKWSPAGSLASDSFKGSPTTSPIHVTKAPSLGVLPQKDDSKPIDLRAQASRRSQELRRHSLNLERSPVFGGSSSALVAPPASHSPNISPVEEKFRNS